MGWQRWLYAKREPSKGVRGLAAAVAGLFIVGGIVLFVYGARMAKADPLPGAALLFAALVFVFAGLVGILVSMMRWTNPRLGA